MIQPVHEDEYTMDLTCPWCHAPIDVDVKEILEYKFDGEGECPACGKPISVELIPSYMVSKNPPVN